MIIDILTIIDELIWIKDINYIKGNKLIKQSITAIDTVKLLYKYSIIALEYTYINIFNLTLMVV